MLPGDDEVHALYACKYLLGGWVTLGEWAFGQILALNDYPPFNSLNGVLNIG